MPPVSKGSLDRGHRRRREYLRRKKVSAATYFIVFRRGVWGFLLGADGPLPAADQGPPARRPGCGPHSPCGAHPCMRRDPIRGRRKERCTNERIRTPPHPLDHHNKSRENSPPNEGLHRWRELIATEGAFGGRYPGWFLVLWTERKEDKRCAEGW